MGDVGCKSAFLHVLLVLVLFLCLLCLVPLILAHLVQSFICGGRLDRSCGARCLCVRCFLGSYLRGERALFELAGLLGLFGLVFPG